jgi:high-affinity iron transporter
MPSRNAGLIVALVVGAIGVAAAIVWAAVTSHGAPNPVAAHTTPGAATLDIGILVFREGLECILVLAAITASMTGPEAYHRRPIAAGAGVGFAASILTWFLVVGMVGRLSESVSALHIQAATGLLAIIVLLVVMNWFFHKIYWTGWISLHTKRKRRLLDSSEADASHARLLWGLGLLGFTSLYREGFEVVLFLQTYRLSLGGRVVLAGVLVGLGLAAIVGILTFVGQRRLPYKRMLIITGLMLAAVLLVMVGEEAQEMQLARWIPTTTIAPLARVIPDWMGLWFSIFPTAESLVAQAAAALLVAGSYLVAQARVASRSAEP